MFTLPELVLLVRTKVTMSPPLLPNRRSRYGRPLTRWSGPPPDRTGRDRCDRLHRPILVHPQHDFDTRWTVASDENVVGGFPGSTAGHSTSEGTGQLLNALMAFWGTTRCWDRTLYVEVVG